MDPKETKMTEAIKLYDQLIADNPKIERKGKTTPYTSLNGHMFSFLSKEGEMGLRLSKEDLSAFIEEFNSSQMEQHGRLMKEYVRVPKQLLSNTGQLAVYLQKSLDYVAGLKPKATKKKK